MTNYNCIDLSIGNTDFHILFSNHFQFHTYDWRAWQHFHLFCECHFLLSGAVRINTAENDILLESGTFCLIPSRLKHSVETVTSPSRKLSFYITIAPNKYSQEDTFSCFQEIFSSDTIYQNRHLKNLFEMLFHLLQEASLSDFLLVNMCKHIFSLAFLQILQQSCREITLASSQIAVEHDEELILKIESFMINNFVPQAQLDDLAQYLHLSQRQSDRLLKRLFGKSFQEIKNETRMESAKELIKKSNLPLKEVASMLGYSSYIGFYKAFRTSTGLSPEEYRGSVD